MNRVTRHGGDRTDSRRRRRSLSRQPRGWRSSRSSHRDRRCIRRDRLPRRGDRGLGVSAFWISLGHGGLERLVLAGAQTFASSSAGTILRSSMGAPPDRDHRARLTRAGLLYGLPLSPSRPMWPRFLCSWRWRGSSSPGPRADEPPGIFLAGTIVVEDFGGPAAMIERSSSSVADPQLDSWNCRNAARPSCSRWDSRPWW